MNNDYINMLYEMINNIIKELEKTLNNTFKELMSSNEIEHYKRKTEELLKNG